MCGIIGYCGTLSAKDVILQGLKQLEYRGYDSSGIALQTENGIYLRKKVGAVHALEKICSTDILSHCGIGHTRWATHGGVNDVNAHPHAAGKVILLHNGIIENYHWIRKHFQFEKYAESETDTETAAQLINYYYERSRDPHQAIRDAVSAIEGSYAFCILFHDIPGKIFAIRNISPLVAASTDHGSVIASDITALLPYTKNYFVVPEYHIVTLSEKEILTEDPDGNLVKPEYYHADWDVEAAQKGGYPHFMLKEIHEQPDALLSTILPRIHDGLPNLDAENIPDELFLKCNKIHMIACGTAMHAGLAGKAIMERELRIPVSVSVASEFRYDDPMIGPDTLVIAISQSGETIDTLEGIRLARTYGCKVLSIVNVKGSTIARESDHILYTHAGPEISVASTKAYMVQLAALYLITSRMSLVRKKTAKTAIRAFIGSLLEAADSIREILKQKENLRDEAGKLAKAENVFYIGRSVDHALSMEGALKLKEISYIHAEAYAAGELKHGTIALIESGIPVIALATQDKIFPKTISNVREVKSRNAYVILITKDGAEISDEVYDAHITIPVKDDRFAVFPCAVILQLLAYYAADAKGAPIDKPRNLAKSVTVE